MRKEMIAWRYVTKNFPKHYFTSTRSLFPPHTIFLLFLHTIFQSIFRVFKMSPVVQKDINFLHASVLSMVEFDEDIFAAGRFDFVFFSLVEFFSIV